MKKTSLAIGMHDKLFKRARLMYVFERDISDLLLQRGFARIETPTLEHFEVFGDELSSEHYHLFDKQGDLLSLRPDITSQIGRVVASTKVQLPVKFSYSGKVFKYNEELRGLTNEHTQAGVEILGFDAKQAVAAALTAAKESLDKTGLTAYQFEFSHAHILQTIFEELELPLAVEQELSRSIQDKNITALNEFTQAYPSQFDELLTNLPLLFGHSQEVLAKARNLVKHPQILAALTEIEELLAEMVNLLPETTLDLGQIASLPYYTGLMFKVFGDKVPDAFVSGGRYDRLFERFGAKELTAVGWALDLDSVYQAVHHQVKEWETL